MSNKEISYETFIDDFPKIFRIEYGYIAISSRDDLEQFIKEYQHIIQTGSGFKVNPKSSNLRIFAETYPAYTFYIRSLNLQSEFDWKDGQDDMDKTSTKTQPKIFLRKKL